MEVSEHRLNFSDIVHVGVVDLLVHDLQVLPVALNKLLVKVEILL